MKISDILTENRVIPELISDSKTDTIRELVKVLPEKDFDTESLVQVLSGTGAVGQYGDRRRCGDTSRQVEQTSTN